MICLKSEFKYTSAKSQPYTYIKFFVMELEFEKKVSSNDSIFSLFRYVRPRVCTQTHTHFTYVLYIKHVNICIFTLNNGKMSLVLFKTSKEMMPNAHCSFIFDCTLG